ncbi:MAG: metallophosphoesterase [Candidatus Micrarchaeia archaeon]
MRLEKDVELLDGLPVAHIKSLSAVVCADLHLGYEGVMADRGIFLPKANLRKIKASLEKAVRETRATTIIVDGDIKNEFSKVHVEEFNELHELVNFAREKLNIERLILIKGNHDNFVDRLKAPFKIEVYRQEARIGGYSFFHGEELPGKNAGDFLFMGHLHPAIALYDKLGVKEKLKCFLYGALKDKRKIVILPAMNYYSEGVEVNMSEVKDVAPVFERMLDVDSMRAFCIGEGETLDFGTIGDLKKIF